MLCKARIHTVVIPVSNLDASRQWYAACRLGAEVLYERDERLLLLRLGSGTHLALVESLPASASSAAPGRPYAVLAVPDASKARLALQALGVAVGALSAQGRIRLFEFTDPDGNLFEVSDMGLATTPRHRAA